MLNSATVALEETNPDSPRLDAELLLSHVLECPRLDLFLKGNQPLNGDQMVAYLEMLRQRSLGCPVSYLTGEKEFWSLTLEVSKDTLSLTSQVAKLGSDSTTADTVALALGKQIHYRNMTALNVIIPFGSLMTFGAAGGLETTIDLSASNPVGIQFNYGMRLDQIYNIGGSESIKLMDFIKVLEKKLNKKAKIKKIPLQLGDIKKTHSDVSLLNKYSGYSPTTDIDKGVSDFIDWYLEYYKIKL